MLTAGLLTSIVLACAHVMAQSGFDLVPLQGGRFVMGDPKGEPDEAPSEVAVASFRMMRHEVTNQQFGVFVAASGHVTDPERTGFGYIWNGRWRRVRGADWRHPFGRDSTIAGRGGHPVVQVSAQDAAAFCRFYGLRLPSGREMHAYLEEQFVLATARAAAR